jgi:hypothetical protein
MPAEPDQSERSALPLEKLWKSKNLLLQLEPEFVNTQILKARYLFTH